MERSMKTIAALIAGLLLSTATFVAGLAVALIFLNAGEPAHRPDGRDTAALWTTEPVAVDKTSQSFERLPPRPVAKEQKAAVMKMAGIGARAVKSDLAAIDAAPDSQKVDLVTTGAIDARQPEMDPSRRTWRTTAHAEWCSRRYRSYNAEDNTYRPYGGGRRACQSPYSGVTAETAPAGTSENIQAVTVASENETVADDEAQQMERVSYENAQSDYADADHIQSCFERYRSYRPEDNSYQPFDGGPRRQCR
jgi:hypothetical protein